MSDFDQMIGRAQVSGRQKEQAPPKYKERPGVAAARKHVEKANRESGRRKNP